ncbi:MAG: hypothetical protein WCG83_00080 [Candidatus Peregrinibacteria bacterium]
MTTFESTPAEDTEFKLRKPTRTLFYSDTVGGQTLQPNGELEHPFNRPCLEEILTQVVRSPTFGGNPERAHTFGREGSFAHLVDEARRLHREPAIVGPQDKTFFALNGAPRLTTKAGSGNGNTFYFGRLHPNLEVVGPAHCFARVRHLIEDGRVQLSEVDGEGVIWPEKCQDRSSHLLRLSQGRDRLRGQGRAVGAEVVPKIPEWTVGAVDNFGGFKLSVADTWKFVESVRKEESRGKDGLKTIGLEIGGVRQEVASVLDAAALTDLHQRIKGDPTRLVLYLDHTRPQKDAEGNLFGAPTLYWPWADRSTPKEKLLTHSPYGKFGANPHIEGLPVNIS